MSSVFNAKGGRDFGSTKRPIFVRSLAGYPQNREQTKQRTLSLADQRR